MSFFVTILALFNFDALKQRVPPVNDGKITDTTLFPEERPSADIITLFRERNGWCPYSQRCWLALEAKGIEYDTMLVDNMGSRAYWIGGTTPQIKWTDGTMQSESMSIVKKLDESYPNIGINLYPDISEVDELISQFKKCFPRQTRPSSRSAFLFMNNGMPVFKSDFKTTLEKTNKLLEKHSGPFFFGQEFTAADIAWAPFLERYANQLPLLHDGLQVYDPQEYPALGKWFDAMDSLPFYSGRIQGDFISWGRVLNQAGFGNAGMTPSIQSLNDNDNDNKVILSSKRIDIQNKSFFEYRQVTPHEYITGRIMKGIENGGMIKDMLKWCNRNDEINIDIDENKAMEILGRVCELCLDNNTDEIELAKIGLLYLHERVCVPRDMSIVEARVIRELLSDLW